MRRAGGRAERRGFAWGWALALALSACAAASEARAACAPRRNALVADLGLHVINLGYQRTLDCYVSAQASVGLYTPWTVNGDVLGLAGGPRGAAGDVSGAVLRARVFVYPFGGAPSGLWLSPFVQGGYVGATSEGRARGGSAVAVGFSAGGALLVAGRLLLSLGVGAQLHAAAFDGSTALPGFVSAAPQIDIHAGFAF